MNLNTQNITSFLFDSVEGNLTEVQTEQLHRYLEQNPEYKKDFQFYQQAFIKKENTLFKDKEALTELSKTSLKRYMVYGILGILFIGVLGLIGFYVQSVTSIDTSQEQYTYQKRNISEPFQALTLVNISDLDSLFIPRPQKKYKRKKISSVISPTEPQVNTEITIPTVKPIKIKEPNATNSRQQEIEIQLPIESEE